MIRAHLVRGAFCLILLVAVCVIPFALGQRATTKQSAIAGPRLSGSGPVTTLSTGEDPTGGTWTLTGSLNTARFWHTATLLPDGTVLVAAGESSKPNASFPVDQNRAAFWSLGAPGFWLLFYLPSGKRGTVHFCGNSNSNAMHGKMFTNTKASLHSASPSNTSAAPIVRVASSTQSKRERGQGTSS